MRNSATMTNSSSIKKEKKKLLPRSHSRVQYSTGLVSSDCDKEKAGREWRIEKRRRRKRKVAWALCLPAWDDNDRDEKKKGECYHWRALEDNNLEHFLERIENRNEREEEREGERASSCTRRRSRLQWPKGQEINKKTTRWVWASSADKATRTQ